MPTKNKVLTAAVLLACSCLLAPYYAHAEEEDIPDCEHGHHYMDINIDSATPSSYTYTFDIYTASTHPGPHWRGEYQMDDDDEYILDANGEKIKVYTSYRDFFAGEEQAFSKSIAYIHNMIQPSPTETVPVIKLELLPDKDANAAASSETYIKLNDDGKPVQIGDTKLAAVLQGKYQPEDNDIVAEIEVDLAPAGTSWYIDKFPVLPSNGINSDYYGTIAHEMFHALGLGANVSADSSGDITFGTSGNYGHNQSMAVFNKYEMGIRDVFGRVAYYAYNENGNTYYDGGEDEQQPINPNASNITINGELVSRKIVGITVSQYNEMLRNEELIDPFTFYVLKDAEQGSEEDGPTIDVEQSNNKHALVSNVNTTPIDAISQVNQYCGAYFTGENVEKVLTINNTVAIAKIAWPDDSKVPAVPGLPLNGYEGDDATSPEMSHIELQNANMSHQN